MATPENILNMIEISFHMEGRPLVGTSAEKAYQTYLIDKDIKSYKDSLEKYRDSLLEDNEMLIYNSVNNLFQMVNSIFVASQTGDSTLTSITLAGVTALASDNLSDQAIALNTLLQTTIGTNPLNKTGFLGATESAPKSLVEHANQITSVIGNEAPAAFSLAGITTAALNSLSAQLSVFISAVESALGNNKIAPTTARTVKSCTYNLIKKAGYAIGNEIYTTSKDITKTMANSFACGKWIDDTLESGNNLYFSHTGLVGDCSSKLDAGEAMSKCLKYLHPDV